MAFTPAKALDRQLTWKDFKKRQLTPPEPGEYAQAAETAVKLGTKGKTTIGAVKGSDPKAYTLLVAPTVTIGWQSSNWVAKYVSSWSQERQDDLLDHEQIHYLISALTGRDCDLQLTAVTETQFDTSDEAVAATKEALALIDVQDINDKYDDDTKHQPTNFPVKQKEWATAVRLSKTNGKPLRKSLETAGLIPKPEKGLFD